MSQFLLPDLGEGLEDAQVVQWLVAVGDPVTLNQPIVQVETAKALVDIPSPFAGTVSALHANPGDTVPVGSPLVTIAEETNAASGAEAGAGAPNATSAGGERAGDGHGPILVGYGTEGAPQTFARRRRMGHGEAALEASSAFVSTPAAPAAQAEVVNASPLVRKMAQERGIDLRSIQGTGPGGRVRVEDLETSVQTAAPAPSAPSIAPAPAPAPSAPSQPEADEERISTVGLRKTIAARMVQAATTIPHFTEYGLFDASALSRLRDGLRADPAYQGQHLTFLPFFVRALVEAVKAYPIMNSRWDEQGNAIVIKRSIHVGIATDTARGLLVPVIRNAHALNLAQIAAESERLVGLTREGKADAKSLTGSTITITNVGAAGPVETGAPLINPPEVCVVGFGAIKPRPTVVGDAIAVHPGAWISVSCDHRVVDGATGARFLGELVARLERPERLV